MDFFTLHIQPGKGEVSDRFYQLGIISIREAFDFVKTLPYKRNSNKSSKLTVLNEEQGTCSTKHTILKLLCEEQGITDVLLFTRVFIMSSNYHSGVAKVLNQYGLSGIPEAHVFLKYDNSIIDCTSVNSSLEAFLSSINLYEEQIETHQTTDYKVSKHRQIMQDWLKSQSSTIQYSIDQLWSIREECIAALN